MDFWAALCVEPLPDAVVGVGSARSVPIRATGWSPIPLEKLHSQETALPSESKPARYEQTGCPGTPPWLQL